MTSGGRALLRLTRSFPSTSTACRGPTEPPSEADPVLWQPDTVNLLGDGHLAPALQAAEARVGEVLTTVSSMRTAVEDINHTLDMDQLIDASK